MFESLVPGWMIVSMLLYLVVILFLIWLAYRLVRAHESLAESMHRIARTLSKGDDGGDKTDRYTFGKR